MLVLRSRKRIKSFVRFFKPTSSAWKFFHEADIPLRHRLKDSGQLH
jgi:hypothetical protein